MVLTEAGAQARARAGKPAEPPPVTGDSGKDAKASPRRPPGAQAVTVFGDAVLQPWLRERKAQDLRSGQVPANTLRALVTQLLAGPLPDDYEPVSTAIRSLCRALPSPLPAPLLHAVLEAARSEALRQPDFASQCCVAYPVLQGIDDVSHDARGEKHLHRLLGAVMAFDEAAPAPAILLAAWLRMVAAHVSEDGLVPFVLHALDEQPPRSAPALANVAGHLALHALRELRDRPDQVFSHSGRMLSWLLRQDGPRRTEGLAGFGDGLCSSRHLSPRLLCEVLQAVAAAREDIRDRDAGADVRAMMARVAGAGGWRGTQAQAVLQSLACRKDATDDPLPREEALATVRGLLDSTLHAGVAPQEVAERLPPWEDLLGLGVLSTGELVEVGRCLGGCVGGGDAAPAVLSTLMEGLATPTADPTRAGAVLRGVVLSAGGAAIDDAQLAGLASGVARTPGGGGVALTLALADALGALGPQRAQALPALRERLEGLLPAPLPATLRAGLALAGDPLGALLREEMPSADRAVCLDAAYALPGLLDEAMVERQLWGCALLAATDLPLALQAARQLLAHAGARITPAAFRELRAAVLPQARHQQQALAGLYDGFARQGRFDEAAPTTAPRKSGAKGAWQQRQAAHSRRDHAAARFLREEAALLGRGLARTAFEPLAQALEALASDLAPVNERKR